MQAELSMFVYSVDHETRNGIDVAVIDISSPITMKIEIPKDRKFDAETISKIVNMIYVLTAPFK